MSEAKPKRVYHPWAVGITIFIVVFLISAITLGIIISQQNYDLVSNNYYEKDLGYQKEINTRQRTNALANKPTLELDRAAKVCNVAFPVRSDSVQVTGEVTFYRISDASSDITHSLALNSNGKQFISVSALRPGQWIAKLRWMKSGKEYYVEKRMYME